MHDIIEFFAVARKENGACPGAIADANDITSGVGGPVLGGGERLVVTARAGREVCDRVAMVAWWKGEGQRMRELRRVGYDVPGSLKRG